MTTKHEKGIELLPDDRLLITIRYISDNSRSFEFIPKGERYITLLEQISKHFLTKAKG